MQGMIGILGGMGPEATVDAFARLIRNTPAHTDQQHIPVIISSLPDIPDRTACILHGGASPVPRMLQSLNILENAGVGCIIIPCNTAHYWLAELKKHTTLPIISIIEVTCQKAAAAQVKKVALLATSATVQTAMYQSRLAAEKITCLTPNDREQAQVMQSIVAMKAGQLAKARYLLLPVLQNMAARGVEKSILGCTEIPVILQNEINEQPQQFINATEELVKSAIAWHFSRRDPQYEIHNKRERLK